MPYDSYNALREMDLQVSNGRTHGPSHHSSRNASSPGTLAMAARASFLGMSILPNSSRFTARVYASTISMCRRRLAVPLTRGALRRSSRTSRIVLLKIGLPGAEHSRSCGECEEREGGGAGGGSRTTLGDQCHRSLFCQHCYTTTDPTIRPYLHPIRIVERSQDHLDTLLKNLRHRHVVYPIDVLIEPAFSPHDQHACGIRSLNNVCL